MRPAAGTISPVCSYNPPKALNPATDIEQLGSTPSACHLTAIVRSGFRTVSYSLLESDPRTKIDFETT